MCELIQQVSQTREEGLQFGDPGTQTNDLGNLPRIVTAGAGEGTLAR